MNKFSDVGDENYSSVRREILTIFRDDRLLEAAYQGSANTLDKMLQRLDPTEPKRYGNVALHIVSRLGHVDAVSTLLNHDVDKTTQTECPDPNRGQTALRIAVEHRQLQVVTLLLRTGTPTVQSPSYTSS